MGFAFHPSKRVQAALQAFSSLFVFAALAIMIVSEKRSFSETLAAHPAWFFAAGLFLFFTIVLGTQLVHVLKTKFILEFSEEGIVDHRRLRPRVIPYSAIEIFSPEPERMFRTEPAVDEFREKVGLTEFISVSARLLDDHPASAAGDFTFFEKVQLPSYDQQQAITLRLRERIARFDRLMEDGGDDADEFDNTNV